MLARLTLMPQAAGHLLERMRCGKTRAVDTHETFDDAGELRNAIALSEIFQRLANGHTAQPKFPLYAKRLKRETTRAIGKE